MSMLPADEGKKGAGKPSRINRLLFSKAKEDFSGLTNIIMLRNNGLKGDETVAMRAELREKGMKLEVIRNRVTLRAFREMGVDEVEKLFSGPTMIVEGPDPVTIAKLAVDLRKKFEKNKDRRVEIIGGIVDGRAVGAEGIVALSKMPTRKELLSLMAGQILSVGGKLSGCLLGSGRLFAGAVKAYCEKLEKGESGEGEKKEPEEKPAA